MIIIVDNGEDYSNHEVSFVECPAHLVEAACGVLQDEKPDFLGCRAFVLGVAESVEWWTGGAVPIEDAISPDDFCSSSTDSDRQFLSERYPDYEQPPLESAFFVRRGGCYGDRHYFLREDKVAALTQELYDVLRPSWASFLDPSQHGADINVATMAQLEQRLAARRA